MRFGPAFQQALALARQRRETTRVKIGDADDVLVDVSDWFIDGSITDDVDQFGPSADLRMHRELDGVSAAPLIESTIDGGRRITVELALSDLGSAPSEGDYQLLFDGRIDDPAWPGPVITLPCRSAITRLLHDRWVEIPFDVPAGTQPESMQYVLDEVMGDEAPTLYVVGGVSTGINAFRQRRQSCMEALRAMTLANGAVVREIWNDAAKEFRLTLFNPDREKAEADYGFHPGDYYQIDDIKKQTLGVRSVVIIESETDLYGFAEDPEAIAKPGIGRKAMYINAIGSPFVTSQAQAQTLAELALKDVSTPLATQAARHALDYRIEVGDVYTWLPNGVHTSETLQLAVTGYQHRLTGRPSEPSVTVIRGRGRPSGGSYRWYELDERTRTQDELGVDPEEPEVPGDVVSEATWLYTAPDATSGYATAGEADTSLGEFASTTEVSTAQGGLFRDITQAEMDSGITLYRSVAWAYTGEAPVESLRAFWSGTPSGGGVTYSLAVDPEGLVALEKGSAQGGQSADEETAPTPPSGSLTWAEPESVSAGQSVGTATTDTVVIVHVRLVVAEGAAGLDTIPELCMGLCVPTEAAA